MVVGFRNGNGQRPQLKVIRGGLDKKEPELANLAKEIEPFVREGIEEARRITEPKEKVGLICIIAQAQAVVDEDASPILKEASEFVDGVEDKALAASLLVEIAISCWAAGLDPSLVVEKALKNTEEAPEGAEKSDLLAAIAVFYAKRSDFGKAKSIMEKITDEEIRKETNEMITLTAPEGT